MPQKLKLVDVTNAPELLHLAEEVHRSNIAHVLKRGDEPLVRVVPVRRSPRRRDGTSADHEAFLSSAGGWKGLVDTDKLVSDIYESRRLSSRPPVNL